MSNNQQSPLLVLQTGTLASARRIIFTINAFKTRYGHWPSRLLLQEAMTDGLQRDVLTRIGWSRLLEKVEIIPFEKGTVIAEDGQGHRFDYEDYDHSLPPKGDADEWIWGIRLLDC